jgi:uncharacterized RDD family membrane protein YckC
MKEVTYAGFWIRTAAALIDSVLILMVIVPLLRAFGGPDFGLAGGQPGFLWAVTNYFLPAIVVILFWVYRSATPGKMVLGLRIVDATTGGKPSNGQLIGRYLGYYVSTIPLLLGIFWVAVDRRKQGWHDKLAGTVVVKDSPQT